LRTVGGINPVKEALRAHPGKVSEVILVVDSRAAREIAPLCERAGVRWRAGSRQELDRLTRSAAHQGAVASLSDFRYTELDELVRPYQETAAGALLIVLDGIEDPQNLGAIVRSAQAFGVDGLILPRDRAAAVTPAVAKASAGAVETTSIAQVTNIARCLDELKALGFWAAAADQQADRSLWEVDFTVPLALVIGAEGKGLRPLVRRQCDLAFRIPIQGPVGSLNASVAAGVALCEISRQRRLAAEK
jgi:23S rRNA (guanosine2251-2'-O)-methyltransferase